MNWNWSKEGNDIENIFLWTSKHKMLYLKTCWQNSKLPSQNVSLVDLINYKTPKGDVDFIKKKYGHSTIGNNNIYTVEQLIKHTSRHSYPSFIVYNFIKPCSPWDWSCQISSVYLTWIILKVLEIRIIKISNHLLQVYF